MTLKATLMNNVIHPDTGESAQASLAAIKWSFSSTGPRLLISRDNIFSFDVEPSDNKTFAELTCRQKVQRLLTDFGKPLGTLICLYFFICSVNMLCTGFLLVGGRTAGDSMGRHPLLSKVTCGLMLGIMATALLQSSAISVSIVVAMVASEIMTVQLALPVVMGTNLGTSVTAILGATLHARNRRNFARAFTAAIVHDMFNCLTVLLLLPLEMLTGYLHHVTSQVINNLSISGDAAGMQFIRTITQPLVNLIVQVDMDTLDKMDVNNPRNDPSTLLKYWCKTMAAPVNNTRWYLFHGTSLPDSTVGAIVVGIALLLLITSMVAMVKLLKVLFAELLARVVETALNADQPGRTGCLAGYRAMLVGTFLTVLVQNNSAIVSALTPLVGLGLVTVERIYPIVLGTNIGTTSTAILAAFACPSRRFHATFQIALCHLLFNLTGIAIWYPVPFMSQLPIGLAKMLGHITMQYRWFAIVYIAFLFVFIPLFLFGISVPDPLFFFSVSFLVLLVIFCITFLHLLQLQRPQWLPVAMRTWDFLPLWMRSLAPLDRHMVKLVEYCSCRKQRMVESPPLSEVSETMSISSDRERETTRVFEFGLNERNNSADLLVSMTPTSGLVTSLPACYEYTR